MTSRRRHNRTITALTYAALLLGSAVFALPFLWMVSSSFKDLETIFEYPPSLLPMETFFAASDLGCSAVDAVAEGPVTVDAQAGSVGAHFEFAHDSPPCL